MAHMLTIDEMSGLQSYIKPDQKFVSSRLANRQLKHLFCHLQEAIMKPVLKQLQQVFRTPNGCASRLVAFITVIGMCMAYEDQQKTIHIVMETTIKTQSLDRRACEVVADSACQNIDNAIALIMHTFYHQMGKVMQDAADNQNSQTPVNFFCQVSQLVEENCESHSIWAWLL
jgi:hypothetical protein